MFYCGEIRAPQALVGFRLEDELADIPEGAYTMISIDHLKGYKGRRKRMSKFFLPGFVQCNAGTPTCGREMQAPKL